MRILEKIARYSAVTLAMVFIGLSLSCVFGVWLVNRKASEVALKGFGVIEMGVGVVDAGGKRVDDLIGTSRTEVRQAAETINTVSAQTLANSPVLKALSERLETSLSPRIAQLRQTLGPVRDALGKVSNAVSLMSALPGLAERAPQLAELDETFNWLEGMSADTTQLRSTLRELVTAQNSDVSPETVATLTKLAQRIDARLGEVQTNVQAVRSDVRALQVRLDKRKSRLLFGFNLLTLLLSLALAWIVYTQIVVLRHQWARVRRRQE